MKNAIVGGLALVLLLSAVGCFSWVWSGMQRGRQISTHGFTQGLYRWIGKYKDLKGVYPPSLMVLSDTYPQKAMRLTDSWGNKFYYESDGTYFILVSYGRDGMPDGSDYQALRLLGHHPPGYKIAGDYDADEIVSDTGWQGSGGN